MNDGVKGFLCSLTYIGLGDAIRGIVERGRYKMKEQLLVWTILK